MARPREFDTDTALRAMTALFWEHGFEGTSMHDIERGTGLRKQSLYRAFGDKRAMYLAALASYEREEMKQAAQLLAGPGDAAARFARLFRHIIEDAVEADDRRGCFLCNACIDQAALDTPSGRLIAEMTARIEETFDTTLANAGFGGGDAAMRRKTARAILAGYFGLRVLVRTGADRDKLEDTAETLLSSLCTETT
jgi:TetR/AcrR family transcriptional regulator, transcriptional repressor for nem operon